MSKAKQYEVAAAEQAVKLARERRDYIDMAAALTFASMMQSHAPGLPEAADHMRACADAALLGAELLWERRLARELDGLRGSMKVEIEAPIFTEEVVEDE